jgi:hypothetical protein
MKTNASVCDEYSNSIQILFSLTRSIEVFSIKIYDIMTKNENKINEGEGEGQGDRLLKWHHFLMIIHSNSIRPFI